jgi:pyroglutamyl-peptidase
MKPKLPIALVTGFGPFAGEEINPSQEIARALDRETIAGHRIVGATLPTEFARSLPLLETLIERHRPVLVLALGQAGGRAGISLERVAINFIDAPVVENAPNAYFSSLPLKAMLARLRAADIEAAISHTAGTFVCNQVFFGLAHLLTTQHPRVRGGFVHVPYLPAQAARHADAPSMALETMIEAVRLCLDSALTTREDLHYSAGSTH